MVGDVEGGDWGARMGKGGEGMEMGDKDRD